MKILTPKRYALIFTGILYLIGFNKAQDSLEISLLSCSPGEELYSTFGHSAFRVKDYKSGRDIVFNYGTFNFREKNFYLKFMEGKLNYLLSVESFDNFLYGYLLENRPVYEQVLLINKVQKTLLYHELQVNALPANRAYKYDFFWDNCSTRIRDKIDQAFHHQITYPLRPDITFRDYLHKYLVSQPWSRFGIDLILGLPADAIAHTREAMFLPLEMMRVYDSTNINHQATNTQSRVIQSATEVIPVSSWFTPLLIGIILFLSVLMFKLFSFPSLLCRVLYNTVMILSGIGGLIISFLWFISEHTTTDNNLNLIWANPLLLLYPVRRRIFNEQALKWLSRIFILLLLLLTIFFPLMPQALPKECILIWMILALIILPDAQIINSKESSIA